MFERMPNYNWVWPRLVEQGDRWQRQKQTEQTNPLNPSSQQKEIQDDTQKPKTRRERNFDESYSGYFALGNSAPPKLRGLAWPGVRDPSFVTVVNQNRPTKRVYRGEGDTTLTDQEKERLEAAQLARQNQYLLQEQEEQELINEAINDLQSETNEINQK